MKFLKYIGLTMALILFATGTFLHLSSFQSGGRGPDIPTKTKSNTWSMLTSRDTLGLYSDRGGTIYFNNNPLSDANAETFAVLINDSSYAKDSRHAYYNGHTISGVDAGTFEPQCISGGEFADICEYAKDKGNIFYEYGSGFNRTLYALDGVDYSTFRILSTQMSCGADCFIDAKDRYKSYFHGQIVDNN